MNASIVGTARNRRHGRIRDGHPWWLSLGVFYLVALAAAAGLDVVQSAVGPSRALTQLTQLGPTVGVVVVLLLWHGEARPITFLRIGGGVRIASRCVIALLAVVLSFVFSALAALLLGWTPSFQGPQHWGAPIIALIIMQLVGSLAEEVGWRGLLQPTLEARWGTLPASITVGILWGAWHVPTMMQGWTVATFFMISTIAMSITMGELIRGCPRSALVVATLFHTATNLGMLAVHDPRISEQQTMFTLAVGTSIVALFTLFSRKVRSDER